MEISQQVLPTEILEVLQDAEFESIGRILVEKLEYSQNQLVVRLRLTVWNELTDQLWDMVVEKPVSKLLAEAEAGNIEIYDDHYLLWEFNDQCTELYVNGNSAKASEYVGAKFYALHSAAFGEWLPLEKYINKAGLFTAVQMPQGLFAQGPKKILKQYESWLNELGKPAYLFEGDGLIARNVKKDDSNLQLLLLDDSYFIGKRFVFRKVAD